MTKRGDHRQTVLYKLPNYTSPPGGATRPESIAETQPLINKHTNPRKFIVWHSDGARCYRHLKNNTRVKHAKKIWTAVRKLALGGGDFLCCYGGTQLQDGLWCHLKRHIPTTANTSSQNNQTQLNKWAYWWVWRFRRSHVLDMFSELGKAVGAARAAETE